nr:hypothetical protein [Jeotgalibacillus proteolyticus]
MIFNYLAKSFKGKLVEDSPEGKPIWVKLDQVPNLPMQKSIRRRFPLFFEEGTFEIQIEWDNEKNQEGRVNIRKT